MEKEEKPKTKKVGIIILVVALILIVGGASFYVGKNFDTIFKKGVDLKEEASDEESEEEDNGTETLDINSPFVQILHSKVKYLTQHYCTTETAYTLDDKMKKILAFQNLPEAEKIEYLTLDEVRTVYGQTGNEYYEDILNFQYSSEALHNSYIDLFGKDDLVDEEFRELGVGINLYSSTAKTYANIDLVGGCIAFDSYPSELISAERTGDTLILVDRVTVKKAFEEVKENKDIMGDYQYTFMFDEDLSHYVLTNFKKISQ